MNMKEKLKILNIGLDEIQTIYNKIVETSTQTLNKIMPSLGESFPNAETEGFKTVNRSLGNKQFEDFTLLEKIFLEDGIYKVKVKSFSFDWDDVPFIDKPRVLRCINDIIDAWKPTESEILKAKKTLENGLSEINGFIAKISDISDKLLNEIMPEPGDCWKMMDDSTDEYTISLYLDDFDHSETIIQVYRSKEGDNVFLQTTDRNHNWTDLPPLEKSFLLEHINKLHSYLNDEI